MWQNEKSIDFIRSVGISATHCIFLHKFEQRLSYIARACVEKYTELENDYYTVTCYRHDKISALYLQHENSLSIKEITNSFLICSV